VRVENRGTAVVGSGPMRRAGRRAVVDDVLRKEWRRAAAARRRNLGGKVQMLQDARDDCWLVDQGDQTEATAAPRRCSGRP